MKYFKILSNEFLRTSLIRLNKLFTHGPIYPCLLEIITNKFRRFFLKNFYHLKLRELKLHAHQLTNQIIESIGGVEDHRDVRIADGFL